MINIKDLGSRLKQAVGQPSGLYKKVWFQMKDAFSFFFNLPEKKWFQIYG